ncbi:MAG: penicillin-binding protein activator [Magnetococcales bacterium]|nr:penicillin-binding protein activator [Magnetococcales bacterium]
MRAPFSFPLVCLVWLLLVTTASAQVLPTDQSPGNTTRTPSDASQNPLPGYRVTPYAEPGQPSPWQRLIDEFLAPSSQDASRAYLQRIPPTPSAPDQIRELLLALEPLSREQIKTLLDRQPKGSSLLPFLQLVLGDRLAVAGEEQAAQQAWQKASHSSLVNTEAMRRIANDPNATEAVVAGLMIPLTGPSAAMGNNLILAARKALADYRDVNLHLEVEDSGANETTAQEAVRKLVGRGSRIIIGPIFHAAALGAAKAAAASKIPIITLNPRQEILSAGGNVFLNAFQPDAQARVMARHAMQTAHLQRFAILAADSDYGRLQAQTFAEEVAALGGTVTRSILFPEQETDFSNALKMIVQTDPGAARQRTAQGSGQEPAPLIDFEALYLPASAKQVRLIAPQAALFGIVSPKIALLGSSLWNRPELLEESESLQGATFCDIDHNKRDQFNASHQKTLGIAPVPALSMLVYDSIAVLAQLLRDQRLGGPQWQEGITRPNGFHGSAGSLRFLDNGLSERNLHLYRIDGKRIVPLAAPPGSGAPDPARRISRPVPAVETEPRLQPANEPPPVDPEAIEAEIPVLPLSQ